MEAIAITALAIIFVNSVKELYENTVAKHRRKSIKVISTDLL